MNTYLALGTLFALLLAATYVPALLAGECPSAKYGANSDNTIKYFSSPFCIACWTQKPIIEKLAKEHGDSFLLEEYDADFCRQFAAPHPIFGVPSYLVNGTMVYGAQTEETLLSWVNA